MDIKLADSELHKKYTYVGNEKILANFEILRNSGKHFVIRSSLIPSITDTKENLTAIKKIIGDSILVELPFNAATGAKYKMFGIEYQIYSYILIISFYAKFALQLKNKNYVIRMQ